MKDNSAGLTPMAPPVCAPETDAWDANGVYLLDSQGEAVAMMLGETQGHNELKRRAIACLRAMRGISTDAIEGVIQGSSNHLVGEMVNKHLEHVQVIATLQESLRMHTREINQLRETLQAANAYEIQRAAYARAPGAKEYTELCRTLGITGGIDNATKKAE